MTFEGTCDRAAADQPVAASRRRAPRRPAHADQPPTTPPTTPPAASIPTASFASDCEGAVTVTLANGADATTDAKLTVKAKDFSETYTVKPGESKNDIVVPRQGRPDHRQREPDKPVGEPYTWASRRGLRQAR